MLFLTFEDHIPLVGASSTLDLVRRIPITVGHRTEGGSVTIGSGQFVLIHCVEAKRRGVSIHGVLKADSPELGALFPIFFNRGGLLTKYYGDLLNDAVYIESLELLPEWRGRQIEEAIAHRVFETWFGGAGRVGLMRMPAFPAPSRWVAAGFEIVEAAGTSFLVQDLRWHRPHAIEVKENVFRVRAERYEEDPDDEGYNVRVAAAEDDDFDDDDDDGFPPGIRDDGTGDDENDDENDDDAGDDGAGHGDDVEARKAEQGEVFADLDEWTPECAPSRRVH